ncbi:MAG: hypothetical protein K2I75_07885, partial [Clostridiales bacterium]|nr:hypothetical protein [Clostridiales bacterium]
DLCAFCADGSIKHGNIDTPALIGTATITAKRFACAVSYMTVVYASRTQAENTFEYVTDDLYFARAVESAAVYCKPTVIDEKDEDEDTSISYSDRKLIKPAVFPPPHLAERKYEYATPFGGLTHGDIIIDDNRLRKPIYNTVSGGQLCVSLNQYGMQNISVGRESLTVSADKYAHTPRAFVVIGENGVTWSPTVKPIGVGQMRAVHSRGYTQYTGAYNGTVCEQKVFTAIGTSTAFIDVTLHNKEAIERRFDITFSAVCDSCVSVEVGNGGVMASTEKTKLLLYAVEERAEYTGYKEGYFVYGKIDRTSGFRVGGSTPAPTASVSKTVKANSSTRVVFCITDEKIEKLHSVVEVDRSFDGVKRFYGRFGRILPATDDGVLNISYLQSLYNAYSAFAARNRASLYAECFLLSAAKYVDPTAVKNRIYRILCGQNQSGLLGGDYCDCLQAVRCAIEYAEYSREDAFWNEVLPYAQFRLHGKRMVINDTAFNHVLRAIKYLIDAPMPTVQSTVQSVWQYKSILYVFRFAEDKLKTSGSLYELYKKRYAQAAEGYSNGVRRLTANNLYRFQSVAEAYLCARLLFELDLDEQAYNIIKYNNPIERCLHYGERDDGSTLDCFFDPVASAVYFTTVTERLFGVKFFGKTLKIRPHIARNMPSIQFDIFGKSKDVRVTVDGSEPCGNWRMRVNKINYPADSVDIRNLSDDIVFYRDGNE